jgi:hypothetical protein
MHMGIEKINKYIGRGVNRLIWILLQDNNTVEMASGLEGFCSLVRQMELKSQRPGQRAQPSLVGLAFLLSPCELLMPFLLVCATIKVYPGVPEI